MEQVLLGLAALVLSGLAALVLQRAAKLAALVATGGAVLGSAIALVPVLRALTGGEAPSLHAAWSVPYGSLSLELDALSALFAGIVLVLSPLAWIQGVGRLVALEGKRSLGPPLFFQNLLAASMVLVVIARNGVLFLLAWEVMFTASFFLVTFHDDDESVRDAGWTYLVATHLGTAFLFGLFVLLGAGSQSFDFDRLAAAPHTPVATGLAFVFALVGFGTKAGFVPLHSWLPGAYPAAPHHVTAVLSGAMSKMGIYGIARFLTLLGPPPAWWGWVLVGVGLTSGLFGIISALAQKDLKRFLGFSSIENVGVVALGLGVGVIGQATGHPVVAVMGHGGALLHVINHAMMKGLLFLSAGSIADATGTREMEKQGGLLKRMPRTGSAFLVGAVAISALPPLNGFASELLIYLGAAREATLGSTSTAVHGLAVIGALALMGGLAAAAFTRVSGAILLGEPRTDAVGRASEPSLLAGAPIFVLAAACLALGLGAQVVLEAIAPALSLVRASLGFATGPLAYVVVASCALLLLVALLATLRLALLSGRRVEAAGTWDCGYVRPTARIQYTASSFAQPLVELFSGALRTRRSTVLPAGIFPKEASHATETPDALTEEVYRPVFTAIRSALVRLHGLQGGRLQVYVLYIALTLLFLLIFQL
ncbi:oxidoreductase [bacterium]|nr:oxidoreductase [bacterium]